MRVSRLMSRLIKSDPELVYSELLDEAAFYERFEKDIRNCNAELLIECPFITVSRVSALFPILKKLKERHVRIVVNTRTPAEHEGYMFVEALEGLAKPQRIGVHVIYTDTQHRKVAIIDRKVTYEGSLNILSQNRSRELMRRIDSSRLAWRMIKFIGIDKIM